jgi:glycyl-tRNA synthetase alpha chain
MNFQDIIFNLQKYWSEQGCVILQPYDIEVGAGTFHPNTFFQALSKNDCNIAYIQGCRRPKDGRYGLNPNRMQHYYQFQVIIKPSPENIQDLYLNSLKFINIDTKMHDIRFVEDDWESPTLGAWGLGWEVWLDGMEISQFTYFQQVGCQDVFPVSVELTYGLERIAMYIQNISNFVDLKWNDNTKYGDLFFEREKQFSQFNFEDCNYQEIIKIFNFYQSDCNNLLQKKLIFPAYDDLLKCSHCFNLLDARGVISVTERASYIDKIRNLSKIIAQIYINS